MPDEKNIELEDRECIRRMADADVTALDEFYARYNRLAFSLVFRVLANREDSEDVLVDVFWQVWQQSSRYDAERGKPVAWLLTIARTRAIDHLRSTRGRLMRNTVEVTSEIPAGSAREADAFVLMETRQAVQTALQALPTQQRVPLELAYFQGMSHSEIAAQLGQPLGTVKDRIRSGMMHLRRRLQPYL